MPEDVQFGGGGCSGGSWPLGESPLGARERECAQMHTKESRCTIKCKLHSISLSFDEY